MCNGGNRPSRWLPKKAKTPKDQSPSVPGPSPPPPPRLQPSKRACTSDPPPGPLVMPFVGFVAQANH